MRRCGAVPRADGPSPLGLLLAVVVTPACVQDRDGARPLLWRLRASHRRITLAWADAACTRKLTDCCLWTSTPRGGLRTCWRAEPRLAARSCPQGPCEGYGAGLSPAPGIPLAGCIVASW
jgi:hypothetical protein